MTLIMDVAPQARAPEPKKSSHRLKLISAGVLGLLVFGTVIFLIVGRPTNSPVPEDIRKTANFSVYYPKQSKLPQGYTLDTSSFRWAQPGVVVYSVQGPHRPLVFSEEQTPESGIVDKFIASYMPLHNSLTIPLGKAEVGSAGQGSQLQTIVSLPINKGPWLIITAPANLPQAELRQILQALSK